ncbi:MAG TPA: bacterioferritin [Alphaproteobacteria bacterium]|jgi:bacterioferritin|nr:bacterioferritin [Alphaproteobacteria bacterium]
MQGDKDVIGYLNRILTNELTTINQYFLHARMLKQWGFEKLAEYEYKQSIDEMKDADELIKRILFLEGLPNLQELGRLRIGENLTEILRADEGQERNAIPLLREAIAFAETKGDYVTRDLLTDILDGEEKHLDWIETQLHLIDQMGLQNYSQSQAS